MAGSSEMDANELTVMPCCSPSCAAVTTVTPADHARIALRNSSDRDEIVLFMVIFIILAGREGVKAKHFGLYGLFKVEKTG